MGNSVISISSDSETTSSIDSDIEVVSGKIKSEPVSDYEPSLAASASSPPHTPNGLYPETDDELEGYVSDHDENDSDNLKPLIQITRQTKVRDLIELTDLPACWPILPDTAFHLDLTKSTAQFRDKDGELLTMPGIIRREDSESWNTQTGSNKKSKLTNVKALGEDGKQCRRAVLVCSGVHKCELLDPVLMGDRTVPDPDEMKTLFEAERKINEQQYSSAQIAAATLVSSIFPSKDSSG
jgi:hypothetical protein